MWTTLKSDYYKSLERHEKPREKMPLHIVEKMQKLASNFDNESKTIFNSFVKRNLLLQEPDLTPTVTADICDDCGVQMMVIANDSMLACSRCAKTRIITSANAWTASMDVDFSHINSHQKSRLIEWLEFAQAKEYGEIPDDVITGIMETLVSNKMTGLEAYINVIADEFEKRPFSDASDAVTRLSPMIPNIEAILKNIDGIMIRNAVRTTASKKYGERGAKVACILTGYLPERMSADQEEYIRKLFMAASPVYDRWRKTSQPIWPGGYAYFLRCILILLGWDEFAALFPIQITGRNQEREDMRREIWSILKWDFVPSSGPQSEIKLVDNVLNGSIITEADKKCKITARGYDEL